MKECWKSAVIDGFINARAKSLTALSRGIAQWCHVVNLGQTEAVLLQGKQIPGKFTEEATEKGKL